MNTIFQFIIRQSGYLALLCFLFAAVNGWQVGIGLYQGSGLHGFILEPGAKGGPPQTVSTWTSFMQLLAFTGLSCLLLGLNTLHRAKISRIDLEPRAAGDKSTNIVIFRSRADQRR